MLRKSLITGLVLAVAGCTTTSATPSQSQAPKSINVACVLDKPCSGNVSENPHRYYVQANGQKVQRLRYHFVCQAGDPNRFVITVYNKVWINSAEAAADGSNVVLTPGHQPYTVEVSTSPGNVCDYTISLTPAASPSYTP